MDKRRIGMTALAVLMIASLGTAALLEYFDQMNTKVEVEQSVILTEGSLSFSNPIYGGEEACQDYQLENRASIPITVELKPGCSTDALLCDSCPEMVRTDYTVLTLVTKDNTDWSETGEAGTLVFKTVNEKFDYTLEVSGLAANTEYDLIYYADPWTGNNPGALIGTVTTDDTGAVSASDSVELGMDLPATGDDNLAEGAKIWLVPSTDYDGGEMVAWNPGSYLFERNLVTYKDGSGPTVLTIMSNGTVDMRVCSVFDVATCPGNYTISTSVVPVVP